jgi:hypothetical protein
MGKRMDKRHLLTKGRQQIRHTGRFKKYFTNFDARRRILHIRANEALALSSLMQENFNFISTFVFSLF